MIYTPFDGQKKALENLIWDIIKSPDFKSQLSNYIRMEIEASKTKYSKDNFGGTLSYDMLTRGNVDMQAKMAASGYDVYGRTLIPSNNSVGSNKNIYQKMKNKINYGRSPSAGYENKGQRSFAKGD
jgi:hypothetical protein